MSSPLMLMILEATRVPWHERMEIVVPLILAVVAVALFLVTNWRGLISSMRTRHDHVLEPIQVEEMMLGMPPLIVDLRTHEEFIGKHGHIRGAVNIPFPELPSRLDELQGTLGNRGIVLVDEGDLHSHEAYQLLSRHDFTWLYVLKGGMRAWRAEVLPTYQFVPPGSQPKRIQPPRR